MRSGSRYFWSYCLAALAAATIPATLSAQGKVWVGHAREFEEILEKGEVVSLEAVGSGANNPLKITLRHDDETLAALWKPIRRGPKEWAWESYQAEVAAYQMDRMLGLNMVPPTVVREIGGTKGSLQLWVDGCRMYDEVAGEAPLTESWARQHSRMEVFDNLISNWDRDRRNLMVDEAWNMVLIDHSQAFLSTESLDDDREKLPERFDRRLMKRLESLDLEYLQYRFGRLLMAPQIEAIIERRDALLKHMQTLVMERGEDAVLF